MSPTPTLRILVAVLLFNTTSALAELPVYQGVLNYPCSDERVAAKFTSEDDPNLIPLSILKAYLPSADGGSPPSYEIPQRIVEGLVERINSRRSGERAGCMFFSHDGSHQCDAPTTRSIDVIAARKAVVLGTVEHLTPVWSVTDRSVLTIVYVRVEEVLKDSSGRLYPGQLVSYMQRWGTGEIGGVAFCTKPPRGIESDRTPVGTEVVVAGSLDLRNEANLITATDKVFKVQNQQILAPPTEFDSCLIPETFSLESLRTVIDQ